MANNYWNSVEGYAGGTSHSDSTLRPVTSLEQIDEKDQPSTSHPKTDASYNSPERNNLKFEFDDEKLKLHELSCDNEVELSSRQSGELCQLYSGEAMSDVKIRDLKDKYDEIPKDHSTKESSGQLVIAREDSHGKFIEYEIVIEDDLTVNYSKPIELTPHIISECPVTSGNLKEERNTNPVITIPFCLDVTDPESDPAKDVRSENYASFELESTKNLSEDICADQEFSLDDENSTTVASICAAITLPDTGDDRDSNAQSSCHLPRMVLKQLILENKISVNDIYFAQNKVSGPPTLQNETVPKIHIAENNLEVIHDFNVKADNALRPDLVKNIVNYQSADFTTDSMSYLKNLLSSSIVEILEQTEADRTETISSKQVTYDYEDAKNFEYTKSKELRELLAGCLLDANTEIIITDRVRIQTGVEVPLPPHNSTEDLMKSIEEDEPTNLDQDMTEFGSSKEDIILLDESSPKMDSLENFNPTDYQKLVEPNTWIPASGNSNQRNELTTEEQEILNQLSRINYPLQRLKEYGSDQLGVPESCDFVSSDQEVESSLGEQKTIETDDLIPTTAYGDSVSDRSYEDLETNDSGFMLDLPSEYTDVFGSVTEDDGKQILNNVSGLGHEGSYNKLKNRDNIVESNNTKNLTIIFQDDQASNEDAELNRKSEEQFVQQSQPNIKAMSGLVIFQISSETESEVIQGNKIASIFIGNESDQTASVNITEERNNLSEIGNSTGNPVNNRHIEENHVHTTKKGGQVQEPDGIYVYGLLEEICGNIVVKSIKGGSQIKFGDDENHVRAKEISKDTFFSTTDVFNLPKEENKENCAQIENFTYKKLVNDNKDSLTDSLNQKRKVDNEPIKSNDIPKEQHKLKLDEQLKLKVENLAEQSEKKIEINNILIKTNQENDVDKLLFVNNVREEQDNEMFNEKYIVETSKEDEIISSANDLLKEDIPEYETPTNRVDYQLLLVSCTNDSYKNENQVNLTAQSAPKNKAHGIIESGGREDLAEDLINENEGQISLSRTEFNLEIAIESSKQSCIIDDENQELFAKQSRQSKTGVKLMIVSSDHHHRNETSDEQYSEESVPITEINGQFATLDSATDLTKNKNKISSQLQSDNENDKLSMRNNTTETQIVNKSEVFLGVSDNKLNPKYESLDTTVKNDQDLKEIYSSNDDTFLQTQTDPEKQSDCTNPSTNTRIVKDSRTSTRSQNLEERDRKAIVVMARYDKRMQIPSSTSMESETDSLKNENQFMLQLNTLLEGPHDIPDRFEFPVDSILEMNTAHEGKHIVSHQSKLSVEKTIQFDILKKIDHPALGNNDSLKYLTPHDFTVADTLKDLLEADFDVPIDVNEAVYPIFECIPAGADVISETDDVDTDPQVGGQIDSSCATKQLKTLMDDEHFEPVKRHVEYLNHSSDNNLESKMLQLETNLNENKSTFKSILCKQIDTSANARVSEVFKSLVIQPKDLIYKGLDQVENVADEIIIEQVNESEEVTEIKQSFDLPSNSKLFDKPVKYCRCKGRKPATLLEYKMFNDINLEIPCKVSHSPDVSALMWNFPESDLESRDSKHTSSKRLSSDGEQTGDTFLETNEMPCGSCERSVYCQTESLPDSDDDVLTPVELESNMIMLKPENSKSETSYQMFPAQSIYDKSPFGQKKILPSRGQSNMKGIYTGNVQVSHEYKMLELNDDIDLNTQDDKVGVTLAATIKEENVRDFNSSLKKLNEALGASKIDNNLTGIQTPVTVEITNNETLKAKRNMYSVNRHDNIDGLINDLRDSFDKQAGFENSDVNFHCIHQSENSNTSSNQKNTTEAYNPRSFSELLKYDSPHYIAELESKLSNTSDADWGVESKPSFDIVTSTNQKRSRVKRMLHGVSSVLKLKKIFAKYKESNNTIQEGPSSLKKIRKPRAENIRTSASNFKLCSREKHVI